MKVCFIGHGNVGGAIADSVENAGYAVCVATEESNSERAKALKKKNSRIAFKSMVDAITDADVIFMATPFQAIAEIVKKYGNILSSKIIIDCTNPVGPGLTHGLESKQSGSAWLQSQLTTAKVVKAFSVYGYENFTHQSAHRSTPLPAMFFCGNDEKSEHVVSEIIAKLGWTPVDVGNIDQALHLEHMTLMWIKMVRVGGASSGTLWAKVQRTGGA